MKKYIDYFQDSHDIPAGIRFSNELPYPHDIMLRDILAELERLNTKVEAIAKCGFATDLFNQHLESRIANMERHKADKMAIKEILADLEANSRNIKQLDTCLSAELAAINARLAALEERLELWESVPQTSVVEGEVASTDNINPFTPPGPTGKEIHQAFVQWMTRRAKLEGGRKP